jgi:hypothetical protein
VLYEVDRLPLLEGLYHVSVAVVDKNDLEVFDFHDHGFTIRVLNNTLEAKERYGYISLFGLWKHFTY